MKRIPYSDDELKIVGEYISTMAPVPKYNTPVTPKENIAAWVKGEKPLWIPTTDDIMFITPRVIVDNIARGFAFENMPPLKPEECGGPDMFGTQWVFVEQVGGSMFRPGNPRLLDANDWKEVITLPDPDTFDWESSAKLNAPLKDSGRSFQAMLLNGLFERLISFMDFEGAVMALIDDDQKDAVHDLFSHLADIHIKIIDKHIEYYGIDGVTMHDDWGSQRAPFFSLATAEEMLVPYVRRIADHCHEKGLWFQQHSCGKNEMLVPAYIDAHVDIWNGQPMNDKYMLYDKYGDQILLGIDLPDMTDASDEEVDKFAREFAEKFKKGNVIINTRGARRDLLDAIYKYGRIALNQ